VLAVVTPALNRSSETFIRRHINEIAPRRTVVVCFDNNLPCEAGYPVLCLSLPRRMHLPRVCQLFLAACSLFRRGYTNALTAREADRLVLFLKRNEVDRVLAEYGPTACAVASACRRAKVPLYVHFHGFDVSAYVNKLHWRLQYRKLARQAAGIVCPSVFLASKLGAIGIPYRTVYVVPCGVDTEEFKPANGMRDGKLLLGVGRFVEKKGQRYTIAAFSDVARLDPDIRLEMIGDGPLLSRCIELSQELGVAQRVAFVGAREHEYVREAMQRASVFVQHSVTAPNGDTEGLPVAILEAMASGLPVVSTQHAGIPEAVVHGKTGLLVHEKDTDAMAKAILRVLENAELAHSMGLAGRRRALLHFAATKNTQAIDGNSNKHCDMDPGGMSVTPDLRDVM